jgi:manganese/zinc/iron transport system ATP- binding protein
MNKEQRFAVVVEDLTAGYSGKPVLWGINAKVPAGSMTAIIGPNGAGKSTLIKAILGLVDTQARRINILEQKPETLKNRIAYVPQRSAVDWDFPASAYDVVMMGRYSTLGLFKRPGLKDKEIVLQALEMVDLIPLKDRQISQLSGGQQQRVFIARSLAQQAEVYFLDEPFAGVDAATEKMLVDLLQKMAAEGKTILAVHHDLHSVSSYFDHAILINMRLVAEGPIPDVLSEQNLKETYGGKLTILSEITELIKSIPLDKRH